MSTPVLRMRYLTDSIATASPGRLLVMLYDRLCLDLERGVAALNASDREAASTALLHAQDILLELRGALRVDGFDGAGELAAIYAFVIRELIQANTHQDVGRVSECLATVRPLRDVWRDVVDNQVPAAQELSGTA